MREVLDESFVSTEKFRMCRTGVVVPLSSSVSVRWAPGAGAGARVGAGARPSGRKKTISAKASNKRYMHGNMFIFYSADKQLLPLCSRLKWHKFQHSIRHAAFLSPLHIKVWAKAKMFQMFSSIKLRRYCQQNFKRVPTLKSNLLQLWYAGCVN